jgi:hypothetical protein
MHIMRPGTAGVATYNLLARSAISRDLLALRATEFLCAGAERLVEVVGLAASCVLVGIHFSRLVCLLEVVRGMKMGKFEDLKEAGGRGYRVFI